MQLEGVINRYLDSALNVECPKAEIMTKNQASNKQNVSGKQHQFGI